MQSLDSTPSAAFFDSFSSCSACADQRRAEQRPLDAVAGPLGYRQIEGHACSQPPRGRAPLGPKAIFTQPSRRGRDLLTRSSRPGAAGGVASAAHLCSGAVRILPAADRGPSWRPVTARGTLRVYLGAAPGVGKTFAMLDEGAPPGRARHRRRRRPSSRPTAARRPPRSSDGLEVVPRRTVDLPRRARSTSWTSTRSWPARPQVALVDELAHTNVPGSAARRSAGRTSRRCSTPAST